ncbi:Leucine aminopeptidase 1 [Phlyctochytrium planicorne]|nr:Leucine aminopeptidase 1 [Phlyctochytrium planicorne]
MKISITAILALVASVSALRRHPSLMRREDMPVENFKVNTLATKGPANPVKIPSAVAFQSTVNPLIASISQAKMKSWLITLTQFPERYYKSQNGVAAAKWIRDQVNTLTAPPGAKLTVSLYDHSWKVQPSVIARYESVNSTYNDAIVIMGTHFDTAGYGTGKAEPIKNPAADDCASGSAVIFEALRVMTINKFIPARPIEIHWYAGEEFGLYGSDEIAEAYAKAGKTVVSYLNLDQSGYVKAGSKEIIGLFTDYTTKASTNFMKSVITTYSKLTYETSQCGYACTDNASWYSHGYEAALAFESNNDNAFPYNDRVNSDGSYLDTVDKLNFDHITEFIKTTLGFVVELSLTPGTTTPNPGPSTTSTATATPAPTGTTCAHDKCQTGSALKSSCDACVAKIVSADSYCGSTSWDSTCVGEVKSVCGITC